MACDGGWPRLCASMVLLTGCTYSDAGAGLFRPKRIRQTSRTAPARPTSAAARPTRSCRSRARRSGPPADGLARHGAVRGARGTPDRGRDGPGLVGHPDQRTRVAGSATPAGPARSRADSQSRGRCQHASSRLAEPDASTAARVTESRAEFNHCLCSPIWRQPARLRIGETRLLQVAFPELPPALQFVDVIMANVHAVLPRPGEPGRAWHRRATAPTDLARPAERGSTGRQARRASRIPGRTGSCSASRSRRIVGEPDLHVGGVDPQLAHRPARASACRIRTAGGRHAARTAFWSISHESASGPQISAERRHTRTAC